MIKKIYIRTFGCQMQVRDSEALTGLFLENGYKLADNPDKADVIIINSCAVRDHAENRAVWFAASLKSLKTCSRRSAVNSRLPKSNKAVGCGLLTVDETNDSYPIICFIGCVAQRDGEALFKKYKHIDLILGPANLDKTLEYVEKIREKGGRHIDIQDRERKERFYKAEYRDDNKHAQVVISTGCSNHCTYCVVPSARGELRLRSPKDIIAEVKNNVKLGKTKITLLGQNVNDYRFEKSTVPAYRPGRHSRQSTAVHFTDLLRKVAEIPGIEEIDFVTSHPKNTSRALFEVMASSPKFKKNLHLPFQSGSNRILKAMNRGYTKQEYLRLIESFRAITGGTLGTDIIVGFPGETEENFRETKDVMEKGQFEYAYIYKYSARPNTPAQKLRDDVREEEKARRHKILLDLQKEIALNKRR